MGQTKVSTRQVLLRLHAIKQLKAALVAELFDLQREVVLSKEMFTVLLCGRRSGKSYLLAYMIVMALIDCEANEHVWYCAMSHKKGVEIIWQTLMKIVVTHRLVEDHGWDVNHSTHAITTPAGGTFLILGVNEERNVNKVRGNRYRLFICDEAQTYDELLGELVFQGVGPALGESLDPITGKRIGRLVVAGTPTGILAGTFYEISTGIADAEDTPLKDRWKIRTWDMTCNPHIQDAEEFMEMQRRKNGWAVDNPIFLQEYKAVWVANNEILVVPEWHKTRPQDTVETAGHAAWAHYIGIDYGFSPDWCSATVVAKRRGAPAARVVAVWKEQKLDDYTFAERVKELIDRYRPLEVTGDTAGAGSRAIQTFNTKYSAATGVYIQPAKKDHKLARVEVLNTALRRKLLFIDDVPATSPLTLELARLKWRDTNRKEIDPRCDDHAFDSLSYCFMSVHEMLDAAVAETERSRAGSDEEAEQEMFDEMAAERAAREECIELERDLW